MGSLLKSLHYFRTWVRKMLCYVDCHNYKLTHFMLPYRKQCKACGKKMLYRGTGIWEDYD